MANFIGARQSKDCWGKILGIYPGSRVDKWKWLLFVCVDVLYAGSVILKLELNSTYLY